jgi:hypothetical protein
MSAADFSLFPSPADFDRPGYAIWEGILMRILAWATLAALILSAAYGSHPAASQPLTPARAAAIQADVRAFAQNVARDVTAQGPVAWRTYFADSPSFFMAVNGRLQFPDSASAKTAIGQLAHSIQHIELTWGDLRVDPLTADLAVLAAPYHELRVDPAGARLDEDGFFTATVERRNGHWQFRNVHWSVAVPAARVK